MTSVNPKVEALSDNKGKFHGASMHESEESISESPNILSNRSHRSHCSERNERLRRERRYEEEEPRREKRYEDESQRERGCKEESRRMRRCEEDPRRAPLDTLKYKIPPFVGDRDVESYLEWEMKVDQVRMVFYEFNGYALVWWKQYSIEVRKGRRRHIDTWLDLKREMRTRFMPASYARDLYKKL
ncbi:hypothetical protein CR513_16224, partial [Mucuna pruriens]